MFYEEVRTTQDLSYISICSLSILYNCKFVLMSMSLGTNAIVVTRVHCILAEKSLIWSYANSLIKAYTVHTKDQWLMEAILKKRDDDSFLVYIPFNII